jgi:hypothetical protein
VPILVLIVQGSDQFNIINIRVHDVDQHFVNIHIT